MITFEETKAKRLKKFSLPFYIPKYAIKAAGGRFGWFKGGNEV